MNCPYRIVFYNNNTMPLSFLPHLRGTLSFLPPPPQGNALFSSSPISGEDRGGGTILLFTLTPPLSHRGRGRKKNFRQGRGE